MSGAAWTGEQLVEVRGEPIVLFAEYIPFGSNNLALLEERLECTESLRDIHLTEAIDAEPERGLLVIDEPRTKVSVSGHERHAWIDFVAEVRAGPSGASGGSLAPGEGAAGAAPGAVEAGRLGVTVERLGAVTYSLHLQRSGPEAERHTLDDLSRVVADIAVRTSVLMGSLLSAFQLRLLDLVSPDREALDKYVVVIARELLPPRPNARDYHAEVALRSELKQVLAHLWRDDCFDLADGSRAFVGRSALLFVTATPERWEPALRLFGVVQSLEAFTRNAVSRMWQTWDDLADVKAEIQRHDTGRLRDINEQLAALAADINLFASLVNLVGESVAGCRSRHDELRATAAAPALEMFERAGVARRLDDLSLRLADGHHVVDGLEKELASARTLAATLADKDLHEVNRVMTILTVVSTIMLPLTVIAGIYGMNFDPDASPLNMPELRWALGYPLALGMMAATVIGMLLFFRSRKLI